MRAALWAEGVKLRRSWLPWLTAGGISLVPLLVALFVVALRDPDTASVAGGKAVALGGSADWPGYFRMLLTVYAVSSVLLCGVVTAWVFGREFSDRTAVDLMAMPTSRTAVVLAKFVVVIAWSAVLTALVVVVGLGVGAVLGLPGWSGAVFAATLRELGMLFGLSVVLVTPVAFAASAGRGYLPAIGLVLLAIFVAQGLVAVGAGAWFPWSVPALVSGLAGPAARGVGPGGYVVVAATSLAGLALTLVWWRRADHR